MRLKTMKTFVAYVVFILGFGTPAIAWDITPLARCFEAMERGAIVQSFSKEDWYNPLTQQHHFETEHVWVFYGGEFFDLYYVKEGTGASPAYCEVKQLYPGAGQP